MVLVMKREDIENAATQYAQTFIEGSITAYNSFKVAAEWRINSVWHKDIQNGKAKKPILVKFDNGLFNLFEDIRDLKGIEDKVSIFAYIEDLLPNKEE